MANVLAAQCNFQLGFFFFRQFHFQKNVFRDSAFDSIEIGSTVFERPWTVSGPSILQTISDCTKMTFKFARTHYIRTVVHQPLIQYVGFFLFFLHRKRHRNKRTSSSFSDENLCLGTRSNTYCLLRIVQWQLLIAGLHWLTLVREPATRHYLGKYKFFSKFDFSKFKKQVALKTTTRPLLIFKRQSTLYIP